MTTISQTEATKTRLLISPLTNPDVGGMRYKSSRLACVYTSMLFAVVLQTMILGARTCRLRHDLEVQHLLVLFECNDRKGVED